MVFYKTLIQRWYVECEVGKVGHVAFSALALLLRLIALGGDEIWIERLKVY